MGPSTSSAEPRERELGRLRALLVVAPILLWSIFEGSQWLLRGSGPEVHVLVELALLLVFVALGNWLVLGAVGTIRARLRRQNDELLALHDAGLAVSSELALDTVLQTIVERASRLLSARYGALSVRDADGRVERFVTFGVDAAERARIGDPPAGRGLLGVVLDAGERLRLDDLSADPRSAGFPPGHPPMRSLLAVPVPCRSGRRGNLYLSEREDGSRFTPMDEETLVRFAQQAAIAIDNAVHHQESRELAAARERLRLAGEMYDGMAQVLAYVNTKSQVVREHVRQQRVDAALTHLEQLADSARKVYAEQRARLLDLKALQQEASSTVDAIAHHVRAWEEEANLDVQLELPPAIEAAPDVELQLLRIVQEGLDNVRRHSRARSVRLQVTQESARVHLELADNGVGFDPSVPARPNGGPRFGLAAMRQRAQAVGGQLEIDTAPGAGTVLRLDLPAHGGQEVTRATAHR